ncbi:hypothetical protein [Patulibacter minatonensis]|uniref:hypothetical protein n=1 Tax=Patulibacter minatonensis TaxID=298163 RepID=UPI000478A340|nr:hypothetical protein [Patulibacter minatonensis]
MPIARPEYGPSLKDVAGPRFRALSRGRRRLVYALPVVVALLVIAVLIIRATPLTQAVIRGPLTFNTRYDDRIARVAAGPGELLHLRTKPGPGRGEENLVFRDAGPPPTRSEPAGGPVAQLALRMVPLVREMRASLTGFQVRSKGRVKIGRDYAGWLVRYQFRRKVDGAPASAPARTFFGVRVLLLPDVPGTTERVLDMSLQSQTSQVVSNIAEAGGNGPMRTPFYGVAFGTEKP